jgi:hypothetical protein
MIHSSSEDLSALLILVLLIFKILLDLLQSGKDLLRKDCFLQNQIFLQFFIFFFGFYLHDFKLFFSF